MSYLMPVKGGDYRFAGLVGTGGIGSGMFFELEGEHTLGRNESRQALLLPNKDYCKLHIIEHYLAALLTQNPAAAFFVDAIGCVGGDATGAALLAQMQAVGINTAGVRCDRKAATLFSVCFQYPDKSGGNITCSNGASGTVTPGDAQAYFSQKPPRAGRPAMVMAVPEVPLAARLRLLELGRGAGFFNVGSVLSNEAEAFGRAGGFALLDFLAVNIDEAAAIAGCEYEPGQGRQIADACAQVLRRHNPEMLLAVTDGAQGCYGYHQNAQAAIPVAGTQVASTAGAGDAFFAGTLAGLACGLPFLPADSRAGSALHLGQLVAGMAVASPDSICTQVSGQALAAFARRVYPEASQDFFNIFSVESE